MRLIPSALAVLAVASAAQAAPQVGQAWSRPAAAGTTGAGFMTLSGDGRADALVAASSPIARKVEIHRSSMTGGVASMAAVSAAPVPATGSVVFAPGGYHLMFIGLNRALKVGDQVPAVLHFASGAKIETNFKVGLAAPAEAAHHHH